MVFIMVLNHIGTKQFKALAFKALTFKALTFTITQSPAGYKNPWT